jgi:hypothetical protein
MDSIGDSVQHYRDTRREDENGGGLSTGGWIVLVIIVLIVLGQTGPARRAGRGGCGCSPIGWLFGGLGLGAWLEHRSAARAAAAADARRGGRGKVKNKGIPVDRPPGKRPVFVVRPFRAGGGERRANRRKKKDAEEGDI